jgi:hypothetical protein
MTPPALSFQAAPIVSVAVAHAGEPVMTRERFVDIARGIQTGASRADVFAKLGPPAYIIAIPDNGHYFQRCRFRFGAENVAAIEFRDGIASAIDITAQ